MSDDTPLVSIIIPTYNHKIYICEAVDSCLNQTYSPVEVIVVDDGSTDGTRELIEQTYGDRVQYICQPNQGAAAARNTGTRAAKGDFVHYCDADDQLFANKVERCMAVFRANPELALVYSQCHYVEADGKTIIPREQPNLPAGNVFCELLNGSAGNFVPQCTTLIRREAILAAGLFNETLKSAEDWDMWLRLAARFKFGVVNEPLALYRFLPDGKHANPVRMRTARLQIIRMAREYPGRQQCLSDQEYDELLAGRHHALALALWENGSRTEARHHLRAAVRLAPRESNVRRIYYALSFFLSARQAQNLIQIGHATKNALLKQRLRQF